MAATQPFGIERVLGKMTTPDQSKGDRSRDEVLAGEYVLGVLSAKGRVEVEARLKRDRPFAAIVQRWEENLSQFNDDYGVELPRPESFQKLEARLFTDKSTGSAGPWVRLWHSVPFWRGLSLTSLIAVASLVGVELGMWESRYAARPLVADLETQNADLSLVASYDRQSGRLRVTPVASRAEGQKSLELWMVEANKPPRSLGVLPQSGEGEFLVPDSMRPRLKDGVTLAVSIEPFGGSPTGTATGPVIASGKTHIP